ncbi:hypothetical protein QOT17_011950 [Balamuthia mandrillaris]
MANEESYDRLKLAARDPALMKKCTDLMLREGTKAGLLTSGIAGSTFLALNWMLPNLKNSMAFFMNWRGQVFLVCASGVAAFWIKGEKSLIKCKHQHDEEIMAKVMRAHYADNNTKAKSKE